jgi:alkanesulfonate monooxygenase SsuD/methylene tetrahydromethanopterin reductase-like flavin-dependent oxidoreductase (luciferase family)
MEVGVALIWQNIGRKQPDGEVVAQELALAELAEPLGFDALWTTEHHFTDYSLSPDPVQFLTYMAGRTSRVKLGTEVVVLPWHDPLRVGEAMIMLDHFSGGRAVFGVGRGLGRIEFEGFGIPMEESAERYFEACEIVASIVNTGRVKYDGTYYQIPEREIRPEPRGTFEGRMYSAAVSPTSVKAVAQLGLQMLVVPQKPYDMVKDDIATYKAAYVEQNGHEPGPTGCFLMVYCDKDAAKAHQVGDVNLALYYDSTLAHYEMTGSHLKTTKGYESYSKVGEAIAAQGMDEATRRFVELHAIGTPDELYDHCSWVRENLGSEHLILCFKFGALSASEAEASMRLFATEVMPRLQALPPVPHA